MEPYRQGGSASSNPAPPRDADLEAHLRAMRLGDPSSSASHLQPHHHAAIPPLLLNHHQQQVLAPRPHMFQHPPQALLPTATRLLPHPEGFFPGAGYAYASPVGAYFPFGANPPSFIVPAAPTPWAAPGPSNPSTSAEEYRPNSRSASALPRALRNGADRFPWTQAEVRSRLVQGQMVQALVMSAESSPHVVNLLAEGDASVRQGVLAGIRHVVHKVMKDDVGGHAVFLELLRACNGKHDELKVIIDAVCSGKGVLMAVFNEEHFGHVRRSTGRRALEELIRMMAWNRPLCERLIRGLLEKERLLEESTGHVVLRHCFTMLPYEECSLIITHALESETIDEVLFSPFGWRSLAECFANAEGDDLEKLEVTVLTLTSEIAKGKWSSSLLRHLLASGSEDLKLRIVDRVAADILDLAADQFGCYVVEACLRSREALQRVLNAVLSLRRCDLQALVLGWCSNYVVQKLLEAGQKFLPELTKTLAFRIEGMPVEVRRQKHAELVLMLIHKLFPFSEGPAAV